MKTSRWLLGAALAWGTWGLEPAQAQQPLSDVISSSGQYDNFAVGGAHRWYDRHSKETKQKSGHCLSILDEAKTYQDKALALYDEAKQPGLQHAQRTALIKQANEQIRLRGDKLRAFTDCVNQVLRQKGPLQDTFASTSDEGAKNLKRVPGKPPTPSGAPGSVTFDKAVDDCFAASLPGYCSPDWSGFSPDSLRPKRAGQFEQSFIVSGAAAEQALQLDELAYGKWNDRELMHDYLIGWLTRCLTEHKVLPMQDPRPPYARFLDAKGPARPQERMRRLERQDQFFYGYGSYPIPPFWNREPAVPLSPKP
jgi:hypothetical protein